MIFRLRLGLRLWLPRPDKAGGWWSQMRRWLCDGPGRHHAWFWEMVHGHKWINIYGQELGKVNKACHRKRVQLRLLQSQLLKLKGR